MSKKFRCGRLLQTKDGQIKKLNLGNGGGTRTCDWPNDRMTFDDVHTQLRTIFSFTKKKHETSLYDFQYQPIDFKQFKTFTDYINKYGLNRNSTVVYLLTSEIDGDIPRRIHIENNQESHPIPEEIQTIHSEYSFIDTSNDLMKNMRELIYENPSDEILTRLFENICLIHGYVSSIIVPLQEHNEQSEVLLYLNNLNNIYEIFDRTKSLLDQNIDHFRHLRLYPTIRSSFMRFQNNVEVLRNRWMNQVKNNKSTVSDTPLTVQDDHERNLTESSHSTSSQNLPDRENYKIFRPILRRLRHLEHQISKHRYFSSLLERIQRSIKRLELARSALNLLDESSVDVVRKAVGRIKNRFSEKFYATHIDPSKSSFHEKLYNGCEYALQKMKILFNMLYQCRMKIHQNKQEKIS